MICHTVFVKNKYHIYFCVELNRLEEKATNMESENKVLRQQAVAISPTAKSLAAYPKSPFQVCQVPSYYRHSVHLYLLSLQ